MQCLELITLHLQSLALLSVPAPVTWAVVGKGSVRLVPHQPSVDSAAFLSRSRLGVPVSDLSTFSLLSCLLFAKPYLPLRSSRPVFCGLTRPPRTEAVSSRTFSALGLCSARSTFLSPRHSARHPVQNKNQRRSAVPVYFHQFFSEESFLSGVLQWRDASHFGRQKRAHHSRIELARERTLAWRAPSLSVSPLPPMGIASSLTFIYLQSCSLLSPSLSSPKDQMVSVCSTASGIETGEQRWWRKLAERLVGRKGDGRSEDGGEIDVSRQGDKLLRPQPPSR